MYKKLLFVLVLILVSAVVVFPQDLLIETLGVSPAHVKRDTVGNPDYLGIKTRIATGLENVGVETKVYLIATFEDSMISDLSWSLEVPGGSETSLSEATTADSASEITTFVPDVEGTYTAIVSEGMYADTVVMNAGKFLGVENNCKNCHSGIIDDQYTPWSGTGHATFLDNGLDGLNGSYYNASCIYCHTVGFDTLATNDGFDDFDFMFPDVKEEGMADSMYATYPEAMNRANIQCESCHGPGSGHNGQTADSKMVVDIRIDACAACHDDDHYHIYPTQWKVSKHANPDAEYTRSSCAPCHNGKGFIQFVEGGKVGLEENVDANYDIACATCHDPHDATNVNQLRTLQSTLGNGEEVTQGGKGTLCMNCHKSRRNGPEYVDEYLDNLSSHYGPHHGPQADVLHATNYAWADVEMPSSPHLQDTEDACVTCHMYEGSESGHEVTAGMHSFAMVDQEGNDNVESCEPCHGNIGESFTDKKYYINGDADHDGNGVAEGLQLEVYGLLDTLALILQPYGEADVVVNDSSITYIEAAAAYNYMIIEEDRSLGIHNPKFAVALLQTSIQSVRDEASPINMEDLTIPMVYSLSQNYPNPFNPNTQINFSLKTAGMVELKVYDILGREVVTLVNDQMAAGEHIVDFDASDLASGIYIYRIATGNGEFNAMKKMVLLK